MQRGNAFLTAPEASVSEGGWLACGLIWVVIGALALGPFGFIAEVGRVLFGLTLIVHTVEAVYVGCRAWMAGFNAQRWFLRTIVLGSLALFTLELDLRQSPRRRLAK